MHINIYIYAYFTCFLLSGWEYQTEELILLRNHSTEVLMRKRTRRAKGMNGTGLVWRGSAWFLSLVTPVGTPTRARTLLNWPGFLSFLLTILGDQVPNRPLHPHLPSSPISPPSHRHKAGALFTEYLGVVEGLFYFIILFYTLFALNVFFKICRTNMWQSEVGIFLYK